MIRRPPRSPLFPYPPLFRSVLGLQRRELLAAHVGAAARHHDRRVPAQQRQSTAEGMKAPELLFELLVGRGRHGRFGSGETTRDRKSTRLNSSHLVISYAVFC